MKDNDAPSQGTPPKGRLRSVNERCRPLQEDLQLL